MCILPAAGVRRDLPRRGGIGVPSVATKWATPPRLGAKYPVPPVKEKIG